MCHKLAKRNWQVFCATRVSDKFEKIESLNATPIGFNDEEKIKSILDEDLYILSTAPPVNGKDPIFENYGALFKKNNKRIKSLGYLSTTSVYGDKKGEWVTEDTVLEPNLERSISRVDAENSWIKFGETLSVKTMIYRLAGIYGPGRSLIDRLIGNEAIYIVDKPGHLFNRIHVEDICQILIHSMNNITHGQIYNISDDKPEQLHVLHDYATTKMNVKPLIKVPIDDASLPKRAKEFFSDNKKVSNEKIKSILMIKLLYPNYKLGLDHLYSYLK